MKQPQRDFCGNTSRREFIQTVSGGFAKLALTGMLAKEGILGNSLEAATASLNPIAAKTEAFPRQSAQRYFPLHVWGPESHRYL